jgi:hypothetical protein
MKTIGVCSTNLAPPPQGLGVVINSWGGGLHIMHTPLSAAQKSHIFVAQGCEKAENPRLLLLIVPWGCQNALLSPARLCGDIHNGGQSE